MERAAILAGDVLTVDHLAEDPSADPFDDDEAPPLPPRPAPSPGAPRRETLYEMRDRVERDYIVEVLESLDWNVSQAAPVLGLERTNLTKRMRKYGLERPRRPL